MASTYLTKSISTTGSQTKGTLSVWLKKSDNTNEQAVLNHFTDSNNFIRLRFNASTMVINATAKVSGTNYYITTNAVFRDTSAWYHIVWKIDTTQATDTDRYKLYVNGSLQTFSASSLPTQNLNLTMNTSGQTIKIGASEATETSFFDGCMTHYHWTDGYAYDATDFGSTDSTTGEWKINTSPSVTYGTNGFFILKDGNSVTDQSGNSNNFTVAGGTLTNTEDCPSNNFATGNPLIPNGDEYSNGNLTHTTSSGGFRNLCSSIGVTSGKYYAECKMTNVTGGNGFGIANQESGVGLLKTSSNKYIGQDSNDVALYATGQLYRNGSVEATYGTISANDIAQIALDADNGYVYWGINGTWQNSANPVTGTGGYALSNIGSNGTYLIGTSQASPSVSQLNFGNGYFGTTAISSEGTNASGIGKFEYDVPTGYTALSTKGLNE